jgi:hypothetical protein
MIDQMSDMLDETNPIRQDEEYDMIKPNPLRQSSPLQAVTKHDVDAEL